MITGRSIRVLFPVEIIGYICVIEWFYLLNFSYGSYSCTLFILSYFLFHTLEGTVRKMAIDMFWQS